VVRKRAARRAPDSEVNMLKKNSRFPGHAPYGRVVLLACLGAAGLLALPASGANQMKPDKQAAAKGRITYVRYCVSCHGREARGDGPLAKDLRVPVPDLMTLTTRNGGTYPFDRVVRIVTKGSEVRGHGTDDMPAWGPAFRHTDGIETFVDEAIRNLTQYLWSVQRSK
jgi:mono/diheme cytochrome c family protein